MIVREKQVAFPEQRAEFEQIGRETGLTLEALADRTHLKIDTLRKYARGYQKASGVFMSSVRQAVDQYKREREAAAHTDRLEDHVAAPTSWGPRGKLRAAREAAGLMPEQLAAKVGAQASYIRNLEDGGAPITERLAKKIASVLKLDVEELLGGSDAPREIDESGVTGTFGAEPGVQMPPGMRARLVPLLSHAQAGAMHGTWIDEAYTYTGVMAPNLPRGARAFAVEIRGDSMTPKYSDGDLVIALWGVAPRQGEDVLACLESGEVLCKVYTSTERGERIVLSSYNPAHPPMTLSRDELRWAYPIDGSYRKNRRA